MMSLGDLCDLVGGRVPLVIELKSHYDGDSKLLRRAAQVLSGYAGPAALLGIIWQAGLSGVGVGLGCMNARGLDEVRLREVLM